jgi:hypothetical protein
MLGALQSTFQESPLLCKDGDALIIGYFAIDAIDKHPCSHLRVAVMSIYAALASKVDGPYLVTLRCLLPCTLLGLTRLKFLCIRKCI